MRSSERAILAGLVLAALAAVFWFLVLSPKREERTEIEAQVAALQADIANQRAVVAAGEQARDGFDGDYSTLVELGKAVPAAADTSNLLVQLTQLSKRSKVDFRSINLTQTSGAPAPTEEPEQEGSPIEQATTPPEVPVQATEVAVAGLPLGATVGAAGLPVMPYDLVYRGGFFQIADFFGQLDSMVRVRANGTMKVSGRLLTVDGFVLNQDPVDGFPYLMTNVAVTSYITPADEGLFAGATSTGPLTTGSTDGTNEVR